MLDWRQAGGAWPLNEASAFVSTSHVRWRVERLGEGPVALLLHGTGASTHSWADLARGLSERYTVIAPDLPGHGFTPRPSFFRPSLPMMARAVGELLQTLDVRPELVVGHSAGAAIALRAALNGWIAPKAVVCLNGALAPFPGMAGQIFPAIAKLLFLNPLTPRVFAASADAGRVGRLMAQTGSTPPGWSVDLYAKLFNDPDHVAGALAMMANWDLEPLLADLAVAKFPVVYAAAERDAMIAPSVSARAARLTPQAELERLGGLGHLAHEEDPDQVLALIDRVYSTHAGKSA